MAIIAPEMAPTVDRGGGRTPAGIFPALHISTTKPTITAETAVTMVFLSTLASSHTPSGMAAQAARLMGVSICQSACWRTCGKSCSETTSSIATTVTTMSAEPNRMAKIGAISMAEPKPAKPRIRPATRVTPIAVHRPTPANSDRM